MAVSRLISPVKCISYFFLLFEINFENVETHHREISNLNMFSDLYYRSLYIWANWIACPIGAIPFKFDRKRKRLYTTFTSKRRCLRIWMFLFTENILLIAAMANPNNDFDKFNQSYIAWVVSSIWCLSTGVMAFQPEKICYLFNNVVIFFEFYKGRK